MSVAELVNRAPDLAVRQVMVTYHPDAVVVCAWTEPRIDGGYASQFVAPAKTAEIAASRVLSKLTAKRRLKRIEDER